MGKSRDTSSGPSLTSSEGGASERRGAPKSLRLSVSSFTKRVARSSETSFEEAFSKALFACGWYNHHNAMREAGWPDRYVRGGRWVELKSLNELGVNSGLSKDQVRIMNALTKGGDQCWYLMKYQKSVIMVPWTVFRDEFKQQPILAAEGGYRFAYRDKEDLKEMIHYAFGKA